MISPEPAKARLEKDIESVLSGLEFKAADGIYAEGDIIAIEVISRSNTSGEYCTLEVAFSPLSISGNLEPEIISGAKEAFDEKRSSSHPGVREAARNALDRIMPSQSCPGYFARIVFLLQEKSGSEWVSLLPEAVIDINGRIFFRDVRREALVTLRPYQRSARSVLEPDRTINQVRQLLHKTTIPSGEARAEAAMRLGEIGENVLLNDILERLVYLLSDCSPAVRKAAALSLGKIGPAADSPLVLRGLQRMVAEVSEEEKAVAGKALKNILRNTLLAHTAVGESYFDSRSNDTLRSIVYRLQDRRLSATLIELPKGNTALTIETSDNFFAGAAVRYAMGLEHGVITLSPFQGILSASVMLATSFQTAADKIPAFELIPSSDSGEELDG